MVFGFVVAAGYDNLGFKFFVYLLYIFMVHFTSCQSLRIYSVYWYMMCE
jgi:hypothetical protein